MNQIWQMWSGGANANLVNHITRVGNSMPSSKTQLGFGAETPNNNYRSSDIRWINRWDPYNIDIVNNLFYYANMANRNAFNFDVSFLNDIQYTTYKAEENGKYDWHTDTFWANPTTYDRKLSLTIQLSDPSEYEGGDFQFDTEIPSPNPVELRKFGTILVFPSFLRHRVTPLTSGTRKSLVCWFEGPKFR